MAPPPPTPFLPSPVRKIDRRHTGRLRKRDNLLTGAKLYYRKKALSSINHSISSLSRSLTSSPHTSLLSIGIRIFRGLCFFAFVGLRSTSRPRQLTQRLGLPPFFWSFSVAGRGFANINLKLGKVWRRFQGQQGKEGLLVSFLGSLS